MRVQISARHTELPSSVRARTEELFQKLTRYNPDLSAAEVIFDVEAHRKTVEGVLSIDRSQPIVAEAEGDGFQMALDRLVDKLGRQLRRHRAKVVDHRGEEPARS